MALRAVYERFLAAPTLDALSPDASWNYITTTTTVTGAEQITKHLNAQQRIVKKKGDKTLSAVETANAIVLDVETTLEFLTGGGAYLPSLDDNFLADRVVTFPTVHIVRFNSQNQIQQVRIYWDQGSLLKGVEVIGSRGRNWPIRDANEQSKLIANVVAAQGTATPPPQETASSSNNTATRKTARPPSRDPSELFYGGEEQEPTPRARNSIISPRAGADKHFRPVRVFGEDDGEDAVQASPVKPRIGSNKGFQPVRVFDQDDEQASADGPSAAAPSSSAAVHQPRAGSTKNFHAIRVFEQGDGSEVVEEKERAYKIDPKKFSHFELGNEGHNAAEEKERAYKSNPNKYSHFELGEGADASREIQDRRPAARSRPMSQWNFEDFNTPEKPRRKFRAEDVRHFGWSDNEDESVETPPARPRVVQPRRDAQTHILNLGGEDDESEPAPRRALGSFHNNGLGLYENNLYDEEGNPTPHAAEKLNKNGAHDHNSNQPLGIVPNNAHRKKDFDAHWEVHDPTPEETKQQRENPENIRPVSADRVKAVQMMNSSWDMQDPSTETKPATTTTLPKRGSRAMFQPSWSLGDVDE